MGRASKLNGRSPDDVLKAKQVRMEKQRAKDERANAKRKSKEMAHALMVSQHERLSRALMLLQVLKH